jgi:hypothetical protein
MKWDFLLSLELKPARREKLQLRIKCEYVYIKFVPVLTKYVNVFHIKCLCLFYYSYYFVLNKHSLKTFRCIFYLRVNEYSTRKGAWNCNA